MIPQKSALNGSSLFSVEYLVMFDVVVGGWANPDGIGAICPGLRGTSYPGVRTRKTHNPERVESFLIKAWCATLTGLSPFIESAQGRPCYGVTCQARRKIPSFY
jgi:hypothetical protein